MYVSLTTECKDVNFSYSIIFLLYLRFLVKTIQRVRNIYSLMVMNNFQTLITNIGTVSILNVPFQVIL